MLNVKLFILIGFLIIDSCRSRYCEICPNHTLCLFPIPGPSPSCKGYDTSALLTTHDISGIINRINKRRNFVALGLSKKLPTAANMRIIEWSEELATSAQRWADQCDPSTRPDREDYCRNLDNRRAGQNIATITGLSPGLTIKSFVDIWFMQTLDYMGSVSYYNQSRDVRTNYFTQLIWAETQVVGCGKAKFLIDYGHTVIERLVCNFAPKGNINGKTVYAIGFAATQCAENMQPDEKYIGLCIEKDKRSERLTSKSPIFVSSSLRILNLSNNSTRLEIDPIRSNINQMKLDNHNSTSDQRNQKIRHVFINTTHAGIPPHVHKQKMHSNTVTDSSRNPGFRRQQTEEKGHSRVYHSHNHNDRDLPQYRGSTERDFKRYDETTNPIPVYSNNNYRRQTQLCTRTLAWNKDKAVNGLVTNKCTRGIKNDCCTPAPPTDLPAYDFNFHNTYKPTCLSAEQCGCTIISCPKITKNQEDIRSNCNECTKQSSEFHYYDIFPNIGIRSGNIEKEKLKAIYNKSLKPSPFTKKNQQHKKIKDLAEIPEYIDQEHDHSYDSFDSSQIQKRKRENHITLKRFWEVDDYSYNQPVQLKSMRYTTLTHKRNRNHKKSSAHIGTEPITIKLDPDTHENHEDRITEKYLSFNELMHLRRFNAKHYDARRKSNETEKIAEAITKKKAAKRKGDDTNKLDSAASKEKETTEKKTTITTTTEEYTTNTPFVRLKHCTRKLTCTWTAASMTGSDGRIIDLGNRGGSRTPPGYVEGCTRTSTCTRDFFNRNIISTTTIDTPINDSYSDNDDDYCERRSLNVQRRNSDNEDGDVHEDEITNAHISLSTSYFGLNLNSEITDTTSTPVAVVETLIDDCDCEKEYTRTKRNSQNNQPHCRKIKKTRK